MGLCLLTDAWVVSLQRGAHVGFLATPQVAVNELMPLVGEKWPSQVF